MTKIKVYLNDKKGGRMVVEAEVLKESAKTFTVRLPDGHIVKRKKSRDIPTSTEGTEGGK